jgi:hypothetical protein
MKSLAGLVRAVLLVARMISDHGGPYPRTKMNNEVFQ